MKTLSKFLNKLFRRNDDAITKQFFSRSLFTTKRNANGLITVSTNGKPILTCKITISPIIDDFGDVELERESIEFVRVFDPEYVDTFKTEIIEAIFQKY